MIRARAKLSLAVLATSASLAALSACPKPAAPPPKTAPSASESADPPPPPPAAPKKCDDLDQGCVAKADTRAPIRGSGWSVEPPSGWTYAHGPEVTVARTDGAIVGMTVHEPGANKKAETANRATAFELVAKNLGVTLPKKTTWGDKPAKTIAVGSVKVGLWQFDGATREGKPGALLAFTAKLSDREALLGVGFVLESDARDSDKAILQSVQSLRGEAGASAADAGADAKGK